MLIIEHPDHGRLVVYREITASQKAEGWTEYKDPAEVVAKVEETKEPDVTEMTKQELYDYALTFKGVRGRPIKLDIRYRKEIMLQQFYNRLERLNP